MGQLLADLNFLAGLGIAQRLTVGVDRDKFQTFRAVPDHTVNGVSAAAAHTDDFYLYFLFEIVFKLEPHETSLHLFIPADNAAKRSDSASYKSFL